MNEKGKHKIFFPGDKGYDENKQYPWSFVYPSVGRETPKPPLQIDGYYLLDRRFNPPIAIFKNCTIACKPGNPLLPNPPVPFETPREADTVRKGMHLATSAQEFVEIYAPVEDPGIGVQKPNAIIFENEKDFRTF